ncbi:ABC transporter substrate-binding protein [Fusibacter ferrireducens]|uniref:ABC transporter substrate-binding protein n=1 Tax=Fusibacter ferrireducens TaxID=2785058 RepID=A0ABR9ZN50_9FIRM|nr:ABC transporter substrate-binding protein [Fusibacter ferrireducens]MBF4691897.1 ABC transporter substrate-binding protein [Fusibacter ferrireducens]
MKRLLALLLIVFMLFALGGCKAQDDLNGQKESLAPLSENEPTSDLLPTLKIGVMSDVGAIPFIIAKEKGFFANRNLPVEITVFRSAMDRDTALQTGNLDGVMADMLTILFYNESGFNSKMIGSTYGNYKLVTSPSLASEDFIGSQSLSIGLSSNTVIDFATEKIAESKQFSSKLKKIAIPQMPVRLEMLKAGELQGATLPDPLASAAMLEGGALIGSTEEMGLYPGIFIASDSAIAESSTSIQLMYEAYNEAVDYLNATPSSEYFDLLIDTLGFPPVLKDQFEMPVFEHVKAPDQKTFEATLEWMKKGSLIKKDLSYDDLTDLEFISKP